MNGGIIVVVGLGRRLTEAEMCRGFLALLGGRPSTERPEVTNLSLCVKRPSFGLTCGQQATCERSSSFAFCLTWLHLER